MTRRAKSLVAKKRLTVIQGGSDIITTVPVDASVPPTTLDLRCKASGKLLARLDKQGLSTKCNWCHEVQVVAWEQLRQMMEQAQKESMDIPVYCPNCIQKHLNS